MKKHTHRNSRFVTIRSKILLMLILISLAMAAYTAVVSYYLAAERVKDISIRLSEQNTDIAGQAMEDYLDYLHELTNQFLRSDVVQSLAAGEDAAPETRSQIGDAATKIMSKAGRDVSFDFVTVFMKSGYVYETEPHYYLPFSDYTSCIKHFSVEGAANADEEYTGAQWALCLTNYKGDEILAYLRYIYEPITLDKVGIVVFGLEGDRLKDVYASYAAGSFLMTDGGQMLSAVNNLSAGQLHPQSAELVKLVSGGSNQSISYLDEDGVERIVSYYPLWRMRAYLVVPFEFYESMLNAEMKGYVHSTILMTSLALLIAGCLALILSKSLSCSVTSLHQFTKSVEKGNSELRYVPTSNDEIAHLGETINEMLDEIQAAAKQREADLIANQVMELQLMQQQINPHLLYNTLDAVLWVIQQNRMDDAAQLVCALSEFFKISLSRGRDMIPLADELRLIRHYLDIQHLARKKEITLDCHIEAGLETQLITKLTIQPLIENAIIHGFSGYRDDGKIAIHAWHVENVMLISVQDNGIGMLEEEVLEVNEAIRKPVHPEGFHHFGLYNINRRIVQTHGEVYGLTVESELSEYTKITMKLPYAPQEQEKG